VLEHEKSEYTRTITHVLVLSRLFVTHKHRALTLAACRQRLQDCVVNEGRLIGAADNGRDAEACVGGGHVFGGEGAWGRIAASAIEEGEGNGVDALLEGGRGVDADSGDEEGGESGELHIDGLLGGNVVGLLDDEKRCCVLDGWV
jgi:hypothetical protein